MAGKLREVSPSSVGAVQTIYSALEPLDEHQRQRVLAAVAALLGMAPPQVVGTGTVAAAAAGTRIVDESRVPPPRVPVIDRPKSVVELIQDKHPKNNAQKLALFAYYRERAEGQSRFARGDLKPYFAVAKEKPAGNYDRDFSKAVKLGWIHEDGSDSYLTSRGLEAVESGFASAQPAPAKRPAIKRVKAKSRRKTR